jgi:hypothetical protein
MSGDLGCGPKLARSQISKFADSSFGEREGCASEVPFICVTS